MKKMIILLFLLISSYLKSSEIFTNYIKQLPQVDFYKSMRLCDPKIKRIKGHAEVNKRAELYKEVYEKNNLFQVTPSAEPKIPKIVHRIWLGGKIPDKYNSIAKRWENLHPAWKHMLWDDNNIKTLFPLHNQVYFDQAKNLGEKSDIIRLEILYRFGGLYVDTDYECLKPFDIFMHCYDFLVGVEPINISPFYIGNAIIASAPKHPIIRRAIDTIKDFRRLNSVTARTGPAHLTRAVNSVGYMKNIMILTSTYLYPLTCSEKMRPFDLMAYIKPESYGIHYWWGSWK